MIFLHLACSGLACRMTCSGISSKIFVWPLTNMEPHINIETKRPGLDIPPLYVAVELQLFTC